MRRSRVSRNLGLAAAGLLALALFAAAPARAGFLNAVTSRDGMDVISVGDSGMFYRAVDGGGQTSKTYLGALPLRSVAANGFTILVVGDNGAIWRSTDNGLHWGISNAAGNPQLLAVVFPTPTRAFAAGASGTFLRSDNGGDTWTALPSGTGGTIRAMRFVDADHGWIVGDGGFSAQTADGGDHWTPGGVPTTATLYTVYQLGSRVWVGGALGTCWKSTTSGSSWTAVNLKMDSHSDVNAVVLQGSDSVFVAGGGGFIRRSVDDGATWTFLQHQLMADVAQMHFVGARGWVASTRSPALMLTFNRGDAWSFTNGTNVSRSWSLRQSLTAGANRGSAIAQHPGYRNGIYIALGSRFYVSRDDGDTWTQFASLPVGYSKVNAFVVSPKDSNVMVCAASPPQVILYTANGGANWSAKLVAPFGEYGIPIEMDPDHPDTLLFGGDGSKLYRSLDFGQTWDSLGTKVFRSPCDLIMVPESDSSLILVGDGITGAGLNDLWRSTDGGLNFTRQYGGAGLASEIPGMSLGRLRNGTAFATNWSAGGVVRTQDRGLTWQQVSQAGQAWGTDVCREDPNLMVFGVYGGGLSYLSFDGGTTFVNHSLPNSNYSFYLRDRNCLLAEQATGIYKFYSNYSFTPTGYQQIFLLAANGGETWVAGSTHDVTWMSQGMVMARIEYQLSPSDPWVRVADVPGYYGRYAWTVPQVATSNARLRISDAADDTPSDESDLEFTIALPLILASPLDFGGRPKGKVALDSVAVINTGTGTLHVTNATTATPVFTPVTTSLTLAPAEQGYMRVHFTPPSATLCRDTLVLTSDAGNATSLRVPLEGTGLDTLRLEVTGPNGGEVFQYGTHHNVTWEAELVDQVDIDYRVSPFLPWVPIASGVPSVGGSYDWMIPDDHTDEGVIRVRQAGGGLEDLSNANFRIIVPGFFSKPYEILDVGPVLMGGSHTDTVHIESRGSAPLTVVNASVSHPTFHLGRTSFTIAAGLSDSLGITFTPVSLARDTAVVTLVTDDPYSPHTILVTGFGTLTTGVDGEAETAFALRQNQPNPFRGSTLVQYAIPRESHVTLEVFDLQGHRVATLVDRDQGPGQYRQDFSTWRTDRQEALASGVYFLRLRAGPLMATRKMLLMR